MTHHTSQLKTAYRRSGLPLLGISFEHAMSVRAIRISFECAASAAIRKSQQGKPAPVQPALI